MARRYGTEGCTVPECERPHLALGLCKLHYRRHQAGTPLDAPKRSWSRGAGCSVAGCERPFYGAELCRLHYFRKQRHGDQLWRPPSVEDRFWAKVSRSEDCWEWTGAKTKGYGYFKAGGKQFRAYRFAWELLVGPIPAGLELDHLCVNPGCVNPAHLEPVTGAENIRRMWARKKLTAGG